ncbi:hypothetical protein [Fervidobacterium islandicum]|uniref:hypothetical protein n=1 Tax=Fervidobacterium islandicum TaxID=2423 RepID=UPI003A60FD25
MICPNLQGCKFFNITLSGKSALQEYYKSNYCSAGDKYKDCARWIVCQKLGKEHVPDDLFPNQKERAELILLEAQSKGKLT